MFICRLIKYDKEGYARIGIMPRYGNADSVKWFDVEANCTLHILNSFEDGNEVVVRGCRALESIIPGPDQAYSGEFSGSGEMQDGIAITIRRVEELGDVESLCQVLLTASYWLFFTPRSRTVHRVRFSSLLIGD
ncbi:hypothetical protein VitviT2T_016421 [Vitis vinifera]|uniref:Uncharacterized protein n=1 Tax=Vitis vinifera TaxID=29760 RepID=A0ABY9CRP0_VITVI|nr:hypothetical protein VitviT2T_016421 [Vitis vinifera]